MDGSESIAHQNGRQCAYMFEQTSGTNKMQDPSLQSILTLVRCRVVLSSSAVPRANVTKSLAYLTKKGESLGFAFRAIHRSRSPRLTPRPRSGSCLSVNLSLRLSMTFGRIRRRDRFRLSLFLFLTLDLGRAITSTAPNDWYIPSTRNHMLSIIHSHLIRVRPDMIPLTIFIIFSTDLNFGSR